MLGTTNELVPTQKGMTSLEIAEVTKKRHDAILRDIRNLLKQGVSRHNFVETSYKKLQPRGGYKAGLYLLVGGDLQDVRQNKGNGNSDLDFILRILPHVSIAVR